MWSHGDTFNVVQQANSNPTRIAWFYSRTLRSDYCYNLAPHDFITSPLYLFIHGRSFLGHLLA
jgi:hypothetical protein